MTPGVANLSPANILKTAAAHDRVMVLLAKDSGLLPGSLARDTKPDFGVDPGDAAGKITTLGRATRCDGRIRGPGCPHHGGLGRPHRAGHGGVLKQLWHRDQQR